MDVNEKEVKNQSPRSVQHQHSLVAKLSDNSPLLVIRFIPHNLKGAVDLL